MGFNMRELLRKGGIEVTGFDRNPDITDVASVDELIAAVPAGLATMAIFVLIFHALVNAFV